MATSSEAVNPPVPLRPAVAVEAAPPKKNRARIVLPVLLVVAALGVGIRYLVTKGKETTDDAFIEGRVLSVSARVTGQVSKVLVQDNQEVKSGDVLVELDDADYQAKLAAAQADLLSAKASEQVATAQLELTQRNAEATLTQAQGGLGQAASGVEASRASLEQAKADLAAAESRFTLAETELRRSKQLFASNSVSQAEVDRSTATFDQANASREQARSRLVSTRANIDGSVGGVTLAKGRIQAAQTGPQQVESSKAGLAVAQARVKQAEAALKVAELNLGYTKVRAPGDGIVSRRSVEVGALVDPSRPLLAVVPLHDVWVVANFKEDQLRNMKMGDKARISVDAFGSQKLAAHLDSFSGGTGSRFALLPPDNASGNFVKVVQRVPVLLRFDEPPSFKLRPGMSAYVTVFVSE